MVQIVLRLVFLCVWCCGFKYIESQPALVTPSTISVVGGSIISVAATLQLREQRRGKVWWVVIPCFVLCCVVLRSLSHSWRLH